MARTPLIVVDADIPYVDPVLGPVGLLNPVPGHRIAPEHVRNADALVVRSVTQVDAALLEHSAVKFVGSATTGLDHVDREWLADTGIEFADAAGANAESVVEYVLAAIAMGLERNGGNLDELTLGVVGCGRIGGRLARRARALGMEVLANDPPLVRAGRAPVETTFASLVDVLERSDIVTVHVPLIHGGQDPTLRLIDADGISRMKSGAWLIQSSRGGTVDEAAAVRARLDGKLAFLAIDVWENEPVPDSFSMDAADVATPHIAGYSRDAKLTGIRMIRDALARSMSLPRPKYEHGRGEQSHPQTQPGTEHQSHPRTQPEMPYDVRPPDLPPSSQFILRTRAGHDRTDAFLSLIPQMIDLASDDARFRRAWSEHNQAIDRAESFHGLRAAYPPRWSFSRHGLETAPPGISSVFLSEGIGMGMRALNA